MTLTNLEHCDLISQGCILSTQLREARLPETQKGPTSCCVPGSLVSFTCAGIVHAGAAPVCSGRGGVQPRAGSLHPQSRGSWVAVQAAPVEGRGQRGPQTRSLLEGRQGWALGPRLAQRGTLWPDFHNLARNFRSQHPVGRGPLWAGTGKLASFKDDWSPPTALAPLSPGIARSGWQGLLPAALHSHKEGFDHSRQV